MKKKAFVTAAVCVLSAACIFGATACNNSGAPDAEPSVKVANAEEWKTSINKSLSATNFTCYAVEDSGEVKSTYYRFGSEEYCIRDIYRGMIGRVHLYAIREDIDKYYVSEYVTVEEGRIVQPIYCKIFFEGIEQNILFGCGIGNRFSEFTYKDGKYTADISGLINDKPYDATFEIKFNDEGYISYLYYDIKEEGGKKTNEINFYNYGNTSFNVPQAAKKAIADYKAANSSN